MNRSHDLAQQSNREGKSMKTYSFFGVVLVIGAVLITYPLGLRGQEPAQKDTSGTEMKQPEPSKGEMETYKAGFKKEMRAFDQKIASLGKKVKKQGSKVGTDAKESWNDLKAKQTNAKSKLKGLSKEAWEKTKAEAEVAREDLRKAYDKAASYFK